MPNYSGNFCSGTNNGINFLPSEPVFASRALTVYPRLNRDLSAIKGQYYHSTNAVVENFWVSPSGEYALMHYKRYDDDFVTFLYYLHLVNLVTGNVLANIATTSSTIYTVAWHHNGQHIVTTRASGGTLIYDYNLNLLRTINFASATYGTVIHPVNNLMIMSRVNTPRIQFYDVSSSNPNDWATTTLPIADSASNTITDHGLAFNEHVFAFANATAPRIFAYNPNTWAAITHPMTFSTVQLGVAVSPDGRYLCALNSTTTRIHIYDILMDVYSTPVYSGIGTVTKPCFSADSKKLYIAHSPNLVVDLDTMTVGPHILSETGQTTGSYKVATRSNILHTYAGTVRSITNPAAGVRSRVYILNEGILDTAVNTDDEGNFSALLMYGGPRQVVAAVNYQSTDLETNEVLPSVAAMVATPVQDD
jgi:hypothetical protein